MCHQLIMTDEYLDIIIMLSTEYPNICVIN